VRSASPAGPASGRPAPGEFAEYAAPDIALVAGDDAVAALERQRGETFALFRRFGEGGGEVTYAPGKWTVKEVLGHLTDDERIFTYRALCVARGDTTPLPGFDEKTYVAAAMFGRRTLEDLLAEYDVVRSGSIALFRGLDGSAWQRLGTVNGYQASPRGLAFHIAGHELHHHHILVDRYLPALKR